MKQSKSSMRCVRVLTAFIVAMIEMGGVSVNAQSGPLDLFPTAQATHTVAQSGNWTDPNTWQGGTPPTHSSRVLIPIGKTLAIDAEIATRVKIIRIQGKLTFSTTANTALHVETIVQDKTGELEIGTLENPIPAQHTCKITIVDEGDIAFDSAQFEKGLVLLGKTVAYGAAKDAWKSVAANPAQGATTLALDSAPVGWGPGDRIVVAGTDPVDAASDETAVVESISGNIVTLKRSLAKNHTSPAADLFVHVANLSRNIVIESENPANNNGLDRGHVMFMHTLDVDMNYVRLHNMGRSRKDRPIDDWTFGDDDEFVNGARTNIRGRYSIHFHRGGVNQALSPAHVRGCVVENDPGWAYVNHSSFVHFDNNVSYDVIGGGFQTEAGDEIGSFTRNIAIRTVNPDYPIRLPFPDNAPDTREIAQDFAFQGDGFWIHGGGVSLSGNVASGSSGHGFIYWPEGLIEPGFPTGTFQNTYVPSNLGLSNSINISENGVLATGWYPVTNFNDNEAYSAGVGLATYYLHTTFFSDIEDYDPSYISSVHSTFDGFTAWNIDQDAVQLHFTERITLNNFRLVNAGGDPAAKGISASHYRSRSKMVFKNIDIRGFGIGLALPPQGEVTVTRGYLKNGTNIYIPSPTLSYRDMLLHNLEMEADPAFNPSVNIQMDASFSPPEDKFPGYFLLPDKIILDFGPYANQRLYFDEQAADYVPLPEDAEPYTFFEETRYILAEFAQKSNRRLQDDYQMSFGGSLMPESAVSVAGIVGGKIHPWQNETLQVPVCIDFDHEFEVETISECIDAAGTRKAARALPEYQHPVENISFHGGYENWIISFPSLTGDDALPDADPDGDGKTNRYEFATNDDPTDPGLNPKYRMGLKSIGEDKSLAVTLPVRGSDAMPTFSGATFLRSSPVDGVVYIFKSDSDPSFPGRGVVTEVIPALDSGLPSLDLGWTYRTFRSDATVAKDKRDFLLFKVQSAP